MACMNKIGTHATAVYSDGEETTVRYHGTTVVTFDSRRILLRTGGWETHTTKTRMNQASNQFHLGYHVYQEKGEWFVNYRGEKCKFTRGECLLVRT